MLCGDLGTGPSTGNQSGQTMMLKVERREGDTEKRQYSIIIMYATENESLMMQKKNHIEIME